MTDDNKRFTSDDLDVAYHRGRRDVAEELMKRRAQEPQTAGPKPLKTLSDVHSLSRAEVNARWDEVQAILGARS